MSGEFGEEIGEGDERRREEKKREWDEWRVWRGDRRGG